MEYLAVSNDDESLLSTLKLFLGMLIAANLSATAIYLGFKLVDIEVGYIASLASFLIFRVFMYMGTKSDELTREYVHYLSVQRSKWALATIAVILAMTPVKYAIALIV